ncbi:porin [Vibrio vulnificus]|uniref:Porin n=1 Tax=Vibrio vulnificus TaxID=672 RepID=A0A291S783_VIBVL|nr:porin [Vibrio vulnificus]ATL75471.1 porin [Vibrio vulnificus]EGQ7698683.1 porin [Vibrio vulnificus]EGQ9326187.1 porin [Vibrio vulnificus]EGQ9780924.1 porin [Vibrio vulnificus]EGR0109801.1 porin [Vibrio vulnificus]
MKKTLIALSVSAAAVATGVNAAELYNQDGTSLDMGGRAEARLSMKDGKVADNSRIRLNFLGKVEIQDGLYGVGFYEGEFTTADNADGSDLDNRYTYAGLGGKFGEVTYGKNDGALGVITDFTDIMAYHGNSAAYKISAADRTDNMLSYKGQFDALSVKASYRFADRTELTSNGSIAGDQDIVDRYGDNGKDGYSLSAIYAIGQTGLTLGGGYADQADQNEYMLAASYTMGDLYFAGVFTDGEVAKNVDYTGYELAAKYTMGQTVFTTTYNNAETDKETSADNFAVDATYYFKPNFRGYVSYNFNLLDADAAKGITKADAEDELALGLRYDF